jgi:hypothetical protein
MKVIHLPTNLDRSVSMPSNAFYIGWGITNLPKSKLYIDLEENRYKHWLWQQIKAKSPAYLELLAMKSTMLKADELILVCSCDKQQRCHSNTVKKALFYLLEQQQLQSANLAITSWETYAKTLAVDVDQNMLHDFCFWLTGNKYDQEQLNFHHLWLRFICLNF